MNTVFFHITSSIDQKSLLEVISKNIAHNILQYWFAAYKDKVFVL